MYLFVQTQFLPFIQSVLIVPHVKPPSWHWVGIMLPARLIGRYHPGCSILSQIVPLTPVFFTDRCHWSRVLQLTSKHGSSTDCENIVTLHANKQLVYDLDAYVHLYMNENMTPYPSRTPLIYMNENLSCMGFETRLISQMPLVKKELSLPEHLSSPSVFVLFVLLNIQFTGQLFVFFHLTLSSFCPLCCLSFLNFLLIITLVS